MDFFVVNGKIWQGNGRFCDAMVLRGGRIADTGREELLEKSSRGCARLDCGGRLVIPGIFDPYAPLPEPPPQKGTKDWLGGQLRQLARAGVTCVQWPCLPKEARRLQPLLAQLKQEDALPRVQLLLPGEQGWKEGHGGRLVSPEELPGLSSQGGQFLVPVPDGQILENLLDLLQSWPLSSGNPRRLTLLGADCTNSRQLQLLGRLGLGIIGFPAMLEQSLLQCAAQPGAQPETCCAWRTLSHLGAQVAFGSTDRARPFAGLQKAVCRREVTSTGESRPSREALTVEEGLTAMTTGAAWMDFQEDFVGRLQPGYRADLLVLDRDVFTCPPEKIAQARPVLTMGGGHILWREKS